MYSLAHFLCDEGKVGNVQLVQGDDGVTPILAQWGATTKSGGATAKSGGATIVAPPSPHMPQSEWRLSPPPHTAHFAKHSPTAAHSPQVGWTLTLSQANWE